MQGEDPGSGVGVLVGRDRSNPAVDAEKLATKGGVRVPAKLAGKENYSRLLSMKV